MRGGTVVILAHMRGRLRLALVGNAQEKAAEIVTRIRRGMIGDRREKSDSAERLGHRTGKGVPCETSTFAEPETSQCLHPMNDITMMSL
jgi:hypothetical protein